MAAALTDPDQLNRYLSDLTDWSTKRVDRLLELEDASRTSGSAQDVVDVGLAFMLWRGVSQRHIEVRDAFALGSNDVSAATRAASLLAAPLHDPDGGVVAADVNEACAIIDRLIEVVDQRTTTVAAAQSHESTLRAGARADLEIATTLAHDLGDQVRHVTALAAQLDQPVMSLDRLEQLATQSAAARAELEATAADRIELIGQLQAAPDRLETLRADEIRVRELAARCREKILDAPNLAVPSVDALGSPPPPPEPDEAWATVRKRTAEWLDKLNRVERALTEADRRFAAPLAERDDLRGVLQGFRAKAAAHGLAEGAHLGDTYEAARRHLWSAPCDLTVAREHTQRYLDAVNALIDGET